MKLKQKSNAAKVLEKYVLLKKTTLALKSNKIVVKEGEMEAYEESDEEQKKDKVKKEEVKKEEIKKEEIKKEEQLIWN